MKPIKLVISAFGPYKDKVEVDFEKIGNNGIFLITGDTGSGKTTIFDAISFALFGEASGSRRESNGFRSDFALDEVSTFVELEFEHKDVVYKLERSPRYMRKKKRGEGWTAVGGDATLSYLDRVVTGEKNVTDECVKILGMNVNQFKQVSMIAQGEFLDLLLSKTKDRASVFRHIFDTSIYKDISDRLKNNYLLKKREYEDTFITIKGYIQSIQLGVQFNGNESTDVVLEYLDSELKLDKEKEKLFDRERISLSKEVSKLVGIISEGKIINDSIFRLKQFKERLNNLLKSKDEIEEKEVLVQENRAIWDLIMPKYVDLTSVREELENKRNKLDAAVKDFEVVVVDYEKSLEIFRGLRVKQNDKNEYIDLVKEYEKKLLLFGDLRGLEGQLADLNKRLFCYKLAEKKKLLNKFECCKRLSLEVASLKKRVVILKDEYVSGNDSYGKHYDLFLSAQAGILASDLKDGQACPVCGSIAHPSLAVKVADILSKEELDREKKELEIKYQALEDLRVELLEKEKQLVIVRQEVGDVEESILIEEISSLQSMCEGIDLDVNFDELVELDEKIQQIERDIKQIRAELGNETEEFLSGQIAEFKMKVSAIEKEIEKIEESYNYLFKKKTQFESLIAVLKEDILKLEENQLKLEEEYVNCYKELKYDSEADYMAVRLEKEEVSKIDDEIKKYREDLFDVNSNISSLENIISGRSFVELDKFEKEAEELNRRLDEINLSLKDINNKISNNKKIYDCLKNVSEKTRELEKEVMLYKDLSDTANGSITGKSKLEFEQYVQASYFDRVLLSANKRFSYMTDDRYQLVRKEEASKVSDKLGLELEVMDYYTGKRRDVKSLSGGESFKAALSLALGMSDAIQEFSGGIVVDAMFIDEGFGSLDDESLEQALNAIMMLSQENRMIGIISHVNELKTRIDKKIVVKKSSSGSSVSFVV